MQSTQLDLDWALSLLTVCALKGERCPATSGPNAHPLLRSSHICALARQGKILIEVSGRNWRTITILTGAHAGKTTASNPNAKAHVYRTVGADGSRFSLKQRAA